ncbi:proteinase inhibitor I4 [Metarhizium guizhouense ARSEF 977]|uniref:Proteinase inhibitor I4 n=1 Tax=Metarhizium guizhouense (strain ARSEF 977) TaxID=1276136 RepID=A0A0B4H3F2_METGA|nr:proteinase inhibitor I4 [Metarhizium guizhouense ARSEF 977]
MAPSLQSIGRVGWDLLMKQCGPDSAPETVILSPLSITMALGMLAGGADESKKLGLCTKLGLQNAGELESVLHPLHTTLCGDAKDGPLALANAVFTDQSVTLFPAYQNFLKGFNAEHKQYPNLAEAASNINAWISDNTRGLIRDMLSPASLTNSHLALVNAIGFKGTWQTKFEPRNTHEKEAFFVTKDKQTKVDMMYLRSQHLSSLETSTYKAVRLPYTLPESYPSTSLFAYLPNEGTSLSAVLEDIVKNGSAGDQFIPVKYDEFGFPKFEIDSKFSLVDTLEKLDYPIGGAYTEMAEGQNQVQTIAHQAYVKVDEEGTEASGATAVIMTRSMNFEPKVLVFNRPFVFAIASDKPDAILFAGIYSGK